MSCISRKNLIAIYLLLACSLLTAQTKPGKQVPPKVLAEPTWAPTPQELFTSYWTLEPGWNTELELRNNLAQRELSITPVLRTADGAEVSLAPVNLKPDEIVAVNLQDAVGSVKPELVGRTGSFGSVVFRFAGRSASNAFAASVVRREGRPIDFHFDAYDRGSSAIEGIWWLPAENATDYLILSNPANKPADAKLVLSEASGKTRTLPLNLRPGQSQRVNLREVFPAAANGAAGGLSLFVTKNGTLDASEIIFDETTGFAAMMKLFDRVPEDKVENRILRAPMMALGQPDSSLGLPSGTVLDPRIFLRNAGSAPTVISPAVNWRNEAKQGTAPLPRLTLLPGQIRIMSLADFQKAGQLPADAPWGTVTLAYTGRRADLVAVAMSYDKTLHHGLQTPFIEGTNRMFKGSMWHADATHNTLITTGNGGTEPTRAQATLYYGGQGQYRVEKLLQPGQQMWLDLAKLIRNQIPDSDGHVLPPDLMTGSYELRDLDHPLVGELYEGKLVIDKTYGHASYGCAGCCGMLPPSFDPGAFSGIPNINNLEVLNSFDACNDHNYDVTASAFGWNSSKTAVATLPNSTLHTVSPGTATGSAQVNLQSNQIRLNCPDQQYGSNQGVTVTPTVIIDTNRGYVYIGQGDPTVAQTNLMTGTGTPSGGTYQWSSTASGISFDNSQSDSVHITASNYTGGTNDTPITLNYTYNSVAAQPAAVKITQRIFKYLAGDSVIPLVIYNGPNTYGYIYQATYNVFANPGGQQVSNEGGVSTFENVTNLSHNVPFRPNYGQGALNSNSQLVDNPIGLTLSTPLPSNLSIVDSQDLGVGGIFVRNNTLTYTATGVTVTSNGPSN